MAVTAIDRGADIDNVEATIHTGSRGEIIVRTRIVSVAVALAATGAVVFLGLAQAGVALAGYTWAK